MDLHITRTITYTRHNYLKDVVNIMNLMKWETINEIHKNAASVWG